MSSPYKRIWVDGVSWLEHRWLWTQAYGPIPEGYSIDHINGDPMDNRLENLRLATHGENMRNAKRSKANSSGLKGMRYMDRTGLWRGEIMVDRKVYRKHSKDLLEVACWLFRERIKHHGTSARFE